jgi:hypothetical protein
VRRLRDRLHGHQAADVLLGQVQHGRLPAAEAGGGPAYQPAGCGVRFPKEEAARRRGCLRCTRCHAPCWGARFSWSTA